MQTNLAAAVRDSAKGKLAESILRKCVHCGFCNATCPTYQLLGDELDGPRGRIYLIKQLLEGARPGENTQTHLDRCLTCRSCETTCPSGVEYSRLLDIGREMVESRVRRPARSLAFRKVLRSVLPYPRRLRPLYRLGRWVAPLLPAKLRQKIPPAPSVRVEWPGSSHPDRVVMLKPCVQSVVAPQIDALAARLLHRCGLRPQMPAGGGCCGAVSLHLGDADGARDFARKNIDAWWPLVENGDTPIVSTSSGCGIMLRDYAHLMSADPDYAAKAARISSLVVDTAELVTDTELTPVAGSWHRVSFHSPCTLQHGLRVKGRVESMLRNAGLELCSVADSDLCCGSAGTYSITQPELADSLRTNKLQALQAGNPDLIVTANIGCRLHLQEKSEIPVLHWLELFTP